MPVFYPLFCFSFFMFCNFQTLTKGKRIIQWTHVPFTQLLSFSFDNTTFCQLCYLPLQLILFPWTIFKQIPNIMTLHLNALVCVFKWCGLYNNITTLPLPQPPKLTVPPLWHLRSSRPPRFPVVSNRPFFNSWICFRHDQTISLLSVPPASLYHWCQGENRP